MITVLPQPQSNQIELPNVLAALGDQTRLAIVGYLARIGPEGMICREFHGLCSKTNLTYHVGKLREAGIVSVMPEGTRRRIILRQADLDERFPGFLPAIIASASNLPELTHYEAENA
jgi:DNA-binding transcriptional ArsR family regulator